MTSVSLIAREVNYQNNFSDYNDYDTSHTVESPTCRHPDCIFLATVEVICFILGVAGNAVVIWIAGFKVKKSVNTTWYLSLAVSNFLFCFFLPFTVVYRVREDWIFGRFMCKFIQSLVYLNMYSSIFILVIISVDRCVTDLFPVWAQNQRTIRKASVIVMLVWIISAVLSTPSLIFLDVEPHFTKPKKGCYYSYTHEKETIAIVTCLFVFGYLIPFLLIIICYIIIMMNRSTGFKKPLKIMMALIVTFFICWLPYHTAYFMALNYFNYDVNSLIAAHVLGVTLATANSCVNPFIYAFMGRDAQIKWYGFPSKIENALVEDEDQNRV